MYTVVVVELLSHVQLFATPIDSADTRLPSPSLSPRVCSNSYILSVWCLPTISSSVAPFSCLHSFPTSGSFPMSQLFTWGGQSIGASVSASVLPMSMQDWFPLELTDLISLLSKGLSKSLLQHHSFRGSNLQCSAFLIVHLSYLYTPPGKTIALTIWTFVGKAMSLLF